MKVAKTVFVLPHGNAEIERSFSVLSDIVTKKRTRLHAETVKSLAVCKSILKAKNWTNSTIPVTPELLQRTTSAYSAHLEMLRERRRLEDQKEAKDHEKKLQSDIEKSKKKDKKLCKLEKHMRDNEEAVMERLREKERLQMLLREALLQAAKSDEVLEDLRNKQHDLEKKKQRAAEKCVKATLKRHLCQSDDQRGPSKSKR